MCTRLLAVGGRRSDFLGRAPPSVRPASSPSAARRRRQLRQPVAGLLRRSHPTWSTYGRHDAECRTTVTSASCRGTGPDDQCSNGRSTCSGSRCRAAWIGIHPGGSRRESHVCAARRWTGHVLGPERSGSTGCSGGSAISADHVGVAVFMRNSDRRSAQLLGPKQPPTSGSAPRPVPGGRRWLGSRLRLKWHERDLLGPKRERTGNIAVGCLVQGDRDRSRT